MTADKLNSRVSSYIEQNESKLSKNVVEFLRNSKFQQVYNVKAYEGADSPSDYWASVWYKNRIVTISFMYQCEPNSPDLDLTPDELFEIYEIYCEFGMKDM